MASAEESLDVLKSELEERLSDLLKHIDEYVEPGRDAIREKPLTAVGYALGTGVLAGVILGVILGRKSKE